MLPCCTFAIIGKITAVVVVLKLLSFFYYRVVKQPRHPLSYGKWVVITGATAGIGREYANYCAKMKMSVFLISRSEDKLKELKKELKEEFKDVEVRYLAYDYTDMGPNRQKFYEAFDKECLKMDKEGGLGVLINNVGIANQYPELFVEHTDELITNMINCNIDSTLFMSRAVLKVMEPKNKGAIINVSSGSGNLPSPYISIYSATKAFITQFSRSMHMEYKNRKSGIDWLVVMPLFVVSQKYRKEKGTLFAPMPIKLVTGTFAQLGKQDLWQVNGYWFHTLVQFVSLNNPWAADNSLKRVEDHRRRYREKLEREAAAAKKE